MQAQSAQENILGSKKMNYDFLLLVRDKKYTQALILGRKILSLNPDNPSVEKFCKFIEKNNSEIMKMVQREKEQDEYESVDEDDQEEGEQQGEQQQGDDDNQEESDQNDDQEQDEMQEQQQQQLAENTQKRQKIQLTTCTLNQIPHICPRHHRENVLNNNEIQKQTKN